MDNDSGDDETDELREFGYDAWLCVGVVCKELIRDDSSSHRCSKRYYVVSVM